MEFSMSNLKNSLKKTLPMTIVASMGLLVACSQMRELKEMHDATTEMRDTTKEMNQRTKEMGANTDEMKVSTKNMEQLTTALKIRTDELGALTSELYRAAKQGTAMALREEVLKKLVNSTSHIEKISKAAKYYMAFEYQIWSGVGPDTKENRDKLAASAAREFIREVQRFTPADLATISPVVVTESAVKARIAAEMLPSGEEKIKALQAAADAESVSAFNALAVTMHILNPIQEDLVEGKKVEKLSMYSMIKTAIVADREIDGGQKYPTEFPGFVAEIRSYIEIAKALVIARADSLGMMALARCSPLAVESDKEAALGKLFSPWDFQIQLSSKVMRDASLFLGAAIEAKKFLKDAGVTLPPEGALSVRKLFANGRISGEMNAALDAVKSGVKPTERQAALAELATNVGAFLALE
jgi:hypothetical protein